MKDQTNRPPFDWSVKDSFSGWTLESGTGETIAVFEGATPRQDARHVEGALLARALIEGLAQREPDHPVSRAWLERSIGD